MMTIMLKTRTSLSAGKGHRSTRLLAGLGVFLVFSAAIAGAVAPEVTVRFANPRYNCAEKTYCVDVEVQSNLPDQRLFGMNVRFFYDTAVLDFVSLNEFQGGYGSLDAPVKKTGNSISGAKMFNFSGAAGYVNGAVQLVNTGAPPVLIANTGWTKVFAICFSLAAPEYINLDAFCPSIVWDLKMNPEEGAFLPGSSGVVITVVSGTDSAPADEQAVQFNWRYWGEPGIPYGFPDMQVCVNTVCCDGDEACDDGNPCTVDNCDPVTGACVHEVIAGCGNTAP